MVIKNMCTLEEVAIKTILDSDKDVGYLWNFEMLIPNIIKNKKCRSIVDKIVYSFHPAVLQEVWKCPPEYLEKYADSSLEERLNELLDAIIFGKPIDILSIPPSILKMLDRRDAEICDTVKYRKHFSKTCGDYTRNYYEIDITEDEDGNTLSVDTMNDQFIDTHHDPNVYFYP